MNAQAPAFLAALEASGVGQAIRQSVWIYPAANVVHVVALAIFAGAVAIMDVRLLGGLRGTRPLSVIKPARRSAILALLVLVTSGAVLFTAEASHVAMNPVFQFKLALILLGLLNAILLGRISLERLATIGADDPIPSHLRVAAAVSVAIWLTVAAAGRAIAYF